MNITEIKISYDYLSEYFKLSWQEVLFALEKEIIDSSIIINLAMDYLSYVDENNEIVLELSILDSSDSVLSYVNELIKLEKIQDEEEIKEKWIYIIMHWIYLKKDLLENPLDVVEEVYSEFNYPEYISMLIRYMPSTEADLGSIELNEQRLFKKWEFYLKENNHYKI